MQKSFLSFVSQRRDFAKLRPDWHQIVSCCSVQLPIIQLLWDPEQIEYTAKDRSSTVESTEVCADRIKCFAILNLINSLNPEMKR